MALFEEEKSVVSSRQCTGSQINQNHYKIAWIHAVPRYSPDLASSDFFSVCKPQINEEVIAELRPNLRLKRNHTIKSL
jgi:hypothetical protein